MLPVIGGGRGKVAEGQVKGRFPGIPAGKAGSRPRRAGAQPTGITPAQRRLGVPGTPLEQGGPGRRRDIVLVLVLVLDSESPFRAARTSRRRPPRGRSRSCSTAPRSRRHVRRVVRKRAPPRRDAVAPGRQREPRLPLRAPRSARAAARVLAVPVREAARGLVLLPRPGDVELAVLIVEDHREERAGARVRALRRDPLDEVGERRVRLPPSVCTPGATANPARSGSFAQGGEQAVRHSSKSCSRGCCAMG